MSNKTDREFLIQNNKGLKFINCEKRSLNIESDINFLIQLSKSSDYFDGFMLVYCLENISLKELRLNKEMVVDWLEHSIALQDGRVKYYLMLLYFNLMYDRQHYEFYVETLLNLEKVDSNLLISHFLKYESDVIQKFVDLGLVMFSPFEWNYNEFTEENYRNKIDKDLLINIKFFCVSAIRSGVSYFEILDILNAYDNYELMDFVYVFLNQN